MSVNWKCHGDEVQPLIKAWAGVAQCFSLPVMGPSGRWNRPAQSVAFNYWQDEESAEVMEDDFGEKLLWA